MYLGSKKVKSTKSEGDYVLVTFEDKKHLVLKTSLEYLEAVKTEKPMDDSDFAIKEEIFWTFELYNLLLKHNIEVRRLNGILNRLDYSVKENTNKKCTALLGKEFDTRTVSDILV